MKKANNKTKSRIKKAAIPAKKEISTSILGETVKYATLGERIKFVREKFLNLSQLELAEQLDSHQVMISRLEKGTSGSLELVLKIVDFLYSKNIAAKELFAQHFSEDLFLINKLQKEDADANYLHQLQSLIQDIKHSVTSDLDKLNSYTALLQYQFPQGSEEKGSSKKKS